MILLLEMYLPLVLLSIVGFILCAFLLHSLCEDLWPNRHLAHRLNDLYRRHSERTLIPFRICLAKCLVISDLTIAEDILVANFTHFKDRGMYSNETSDPLSAILGSLNHSEWTRLRSTVSPAFTPTKIKDMFRTMRDTANKMVAKLQWDISTGNIVEIRDFFSLFATDVIGEVAIGNECNTLSDADNKLRQMLKESLTVKFKYTRLAIAHPKIARWLGIRKHSAERNQFFIDFVMQTIEYRRKNPADRNDYMQFLIDANLPVKQIAALTHDFLSAGYSDSTSTLTYCLYELSLPQNAHIQDTIRQEIRSVLKQHNGEFKYDMVHSMVYCKKVIDETLRKHPPGGYLMRKATESYRVPNTDITIPEGMRIFIPVYAIHHDERFHPDPDIFNPERDLTCGKTYIPFGRGPRQCIGLRFARLLVYTGLVSLLRNFEFSTCNRTPIPMEYSSAKNTLVPKAGVWLKVSPL